MRFTKIPLIATLMAVALSLLIVLPALGQYADNTDGKRGSGNLEVGVFADIADAQLGKLEPATGGGAVGGVYVPVGSQNDSVPAHLDAYTPGEQGRADRPTYLTNPAVSPQDTSFNGALYVSNQIGAYNTVLIDVTNPDLDGDNNPVDFPSTCTTENPKEAVVTATVRNNSSNKTLTLELPTSGAHAQAFFKVVREGSTYRSNAQDPAVDVTFSNDGDVSNEREHDGPIWCADVTEIDTDGDGVPDAPKETQADTAVYTKADVDPNASPMTEQPIATIFAQHGDRITVTTNQGSGSIELIVDGEGPEFSAITPEDNAVTRPGKLTFGFEVRDDDSGLRHDGEAVISPDGDYDEINADDDHVLSGEPLATRTSRGNGKSEDIDVRVTAFDRDDIDDCMMNDGCDISATGTWGMVGNRAGVAYDFTASGTGRDDGTYLYQLVAKDRAGNVSMSDAVRDTTDDNEPYVFRVDDTEPALSSARTGISYDTDENAEEVDLSFIALDFGGDALGDVNTDYITVVGHTIVGVVHPSKAPRVQRGKGSHDPAPDPGDCDEAEPEDDDACAAWENYKEDYPATEIGEDGDMRIMEPRSRIYLELADDLAADEKPTVVLVSGAVTDLAGNENESGNRKAADWIAPTLTVTVTGTGMSADKERQVANEDGSFTIDVRSNEDVNRRPMVYFVQLMADEKIMSVASASSLTQQEDENHWSKKYDADSIRSDSDIVGIVVLTADSETNSGATDGWKPGMHRDADAPAGGDSLDFEKMDDAGLLIEIDMDFNKTEDPVGAVTPRSDADSMETESANPFVKLTFDDEKSEYDKYGLKETHDSVEITEITLNGDDAMDRLNRVGATEFSLVVRDLEIGDHSVKYTAEDDAGNEAEFEFEFSRVEREPYEIDVKPGWNLISLPATPVESAIGDVFSGNEYISPVVGYQNGDWVTAVQEEDGTWRGRLETIQGGYGYWVLARTFSTIETMLSQVDPAGTLPTVPVTNGWNLLGVLDIYQNAAGKAPGVAGENGDEADNYFSSIPWRVAYTYATETSAWTKTTPKADTTGTDASEAGYRTKPGEKEGDDPVVVKQEILNGMGYWVWSSEPSTLVP